MEIRDVTGVIRSMPFREQDLDALSNDLRRRPAEDLLRATIEESDALKVVHADDRIRRNPDDLGEYFVGYSIGHAL
jgi:hypothetical protein